MKRISSLSRLLGIVLSLLGLAALAPAQAPEQGDYRLKPNDQISMTIFEHTDLLTLVQLTASGEASFQLIGTIKLGGKTLREAESLVAAAYDADYLVDPRVSINLTVAAIEQISVTGAVANPGLVDVPPNGQLDLVGAITGVGDVTSNADGMRIELKRGGQVLHYNLDQLRAKGAAQVFLQEGDRVVVPLNPFAGKSVTVVGEIVKAGAVSFPANGKLALATVVGIAGGLTPDADPARISVKRDGKIWGLQLEARNQLLKPGDVITIPKSRFVGKVVILMGQVKKVGAVPFTLNGKLDILTAIANAGGYAPLANKKKVTVTRRQGGRSQTWKLNLTDMANGEEPLFQLLPGDTIMVPERKF